MERRKKIVPLCCLYLLNHLCIYEYISLLALLACTRRDSRDSWYFNELRKAVWKYLRRLPGDWSARTLDLSTLPKPTHRELLVCVWTSQSICLLSPVVYSHNYCKKHIIVKRKVVFFFLRTMKFTHLYISHTWLFSIILFQNEITVTI